MLFVCAGVPSSAVDTLVGTTLRKLLPEDNAGPGPPEVASRSLAAISSRTVLPDTSSLPSCPERALDAFEPLADLMAARRVCPSASKSSISFNSLRFCRTTAAAMTSSSSSDERTVTEDIDDECTITAAPDSFVSTRCIGVIAGAAVERTVLVSSVPRDAFVGGRGGL